MAIPIWRRFEAHWATWALFIEFFELTQGYDSDHNKAFYKREGDSP